VGHVGYHVQIAATGLIELVDERPSACGEHFLSLNGAGDGYEEESAALSVTEREVFVATSSAAHSRCCALYGPDVFARA